MLAVAVVVLFLAPLGVLRHRALSAATSVNYVENQEGTGGTLIVSDGVHTANITLLGQYAADGFTVEADGTSGTLLSYRDHLT